MGQVTRSSGAPTDEMILLLIEQKDEKGYSLLYDRYWKQLVRYAYSFVEEQDTAKEIVQKLLVSFFTGHVVVRNRQSLLPYLYQSVRNQVINHYRSVHNYNKHIHSQRPQDIVTSDMVTGSLYFADLQKEIKRCLSGLSPKYAEVFILNRERYLTVREIAVKLDRPEGTVEKQLRKVLAHLKEHLDKSDFKPM